MIEQWNSKKEIETKRTNKRKRKRKRIAKQATRGWNGKKGMTCTKQDEVTLTEH